MNAQPVAPQVRLDLFDNSWYSPGGSAWLRAAWFFAGQPFLGARWQPLSAPRRWVLRLFGASVGQGVVIKPGVRVKYPWHLRVGDYAWIGEDCWIDNLTAVDIAAHACLSQRAYLCTGNHDWSLPEFSLRTAPISVGIGAWVGACAVLAPGVQLGEGAIASLGSVVTQSIPAWEIHGGNPAKFLRLRRLKSGPPVAGEVQENIP